MYYAHRCHLLRLDYRPMKLQKKSQKIKIKIEIAYIGNNEVIYHFQQPLAELQLADHRLRIQRLWEKNTKSNNGLVEIMWNVQTTHNQLQASVMFMFIYWNRTMKIRSFRADKNDYFEMHYWIKTNRFLHHRHYFVVVHYFLQPHRYDPHLQHRLAQQRRCLKNHSIMFNTIRKKKFSTKF